MGLSSKAMRPPLAAIMPTLRRFYVRAVALYAVTIVVPTGVLVYRRFLRITNRPAPEARSQNVEGSGTAAVEVNVHSPAQITVRPRTSGSAGPCDT